MRYAEYPPDPRLAAFVRCFWVFEHAFAPHETRDERIVPDGSPELIFHFGDPYTEIREIDADQVAARQPKSLFAGQITKPLLLRAAGHAGVVGVRFTPWGARRFIDRPMRETVDRRIDLRDLWVSSLDELEQRLHGADSDSARIVAIEPVLLDKAARSSRTDDDAVAACVAEMQRTQEAIPPNRMRRISGLGERQLERRFLDIVGLSPKLLASILRFRSLFDAFQSSGDAPWLRAAIDSGYFDQAHMIRDFKRFAGRPPQAFYQSLSGLSAAMVSADI